mmetsp:Transcript_27589/g.58306  ORF Transcript_27589/g.58306 Transcript_27589/m.58306 type:complete len:391 (+) Transcript_27589:296-1468(+)
MKFQWIRLDEKGSVGECHQFDTERSAYALKLDCHDENDRMSSSERKLSLVSLERVAVDSTIKNSSGQELVSYSDIALAQLKSYNDKRRWFQDTCSQLSLESDGRVGCMRLNICREHVLEDSMEAVMSLSRKDFRKVFRIDFIGEPGLGDGPDHSYHANLMEWFESVTEKVFSDVGLWHTNATNPMRLQINPESGKTRPEDHLIYFRFIGRVIGKALFDSRALEFEGTWPIKSRLAKHLYKHMLGFPVMFNDLKDIDEGCYNTLDRLKDMGADAKTAGFDFTNMDNDTLGVKQMLELIPGRGNVDTTEENLLENIEACLKYFLFEQYEVQLNELLLGFFDVIPQPLLTIFDSEELEAMMCGGALPDQEPSRSHATTSHCTNCNCSNCTDKL